MRKLTSTFVYSAPLLTLLACANGNPDGFAGISEFSHSATGYGATVEAGAPAEVDASQKAVDPIDGKNQGAPSSTWSIGGKVTGLAGTGLLLVDNGGDELPIAADGTFTFNKQVRDGEPFAVAVKAQPTGTPTQTCVVKGGTGTVMKGNVSSIAVNCTLANFTVGGTTDNVVGTGLVLTLGDNDVSISSNGTFAFVDPIASGLPYAVAVKTQPAGQLCSIKSASGTITNADVTSVTVGCTTFANPSFESGFDGWTLTNVEGTNSDLYGGIATIASGTTLHVNDTVQDLLSGGPVTLGFPCSAYPTTYSALSARNGTNLGLLFTANNSSHFKASQTVMLNSVVSTMTFDVQYASGLPMDDTWQFVTLKVYDATSNALLATPFFAGTGAPQAAPMTTVTADLSAYAGTSVRIELESRGIADPLFAAFDAITLP